MKRAAKLGLMLMTTLMLWVLLWHHRQANELQRQIRLAKQERKGYVQIDQRHTKLKREVVKAWDERQTAWKQLQGWLADCTSRDDFIVREGPWIVASELRPYELKDKRVGLYVPEGMHELKFAIKRCRVDNHFPSQTAEAFFQEDARRLSGIITFELVNTPQVFELQLAVVEDSTSPSLHIQLLGEDNAMLEGRQVRLMAGSPGLDESYTRFLPLLAFPNEVNMEQRNWEQRLLRGTPTTELLHLTSKGEGDEQLGIRVWLSSAAPWCMGALHVAHDLERLSDKMTKSASLNVYRFDDLFEPYEVDSGRLQFGANLRLPHWDLRQEAEAN